MEYFKGIEKMMSEQLHITADKRLRYASPKLPSATSFIRKMLNEMGIFEIFDFSF